MMVKQSIVFSRVSVCACLCVYHNDQISYILNEITYSIHQGAKLVLESKFPGVRVLAQSWT